MLAVDTSTPSLARAYDHLLGGRANFAADRSLAARLQRMYPRTPTLLSLSRAYTATAVSASAAAGVAQFIDVGCGLPTSPAVHEVALRARREARVVYVDRDPAVVSHAAALVPPTVRVIEGDLAEPEALLWSMRPLLDLSRPACLVLALVVQALPDPGLARAVVDVLVRGLAPGSHLIMTAGHGDDGRLPDGVTRASLTERDFESFFTGLDLLPPGIEAGPVLCGAGRKL
jgi:SAM-dependent methyltransferase